MRDGDRIRVTFTWDGCPGSAIGQGPSDLSADIDLFFCVDDDKTCVKTSRSYDNNVEGFDYTVPSGTATKDYTLYHGYDPDNSPGCGSTLEPAGWAYVVGRVTDFS